MTAQEKFEARLKELGLDVEYERTGDKVGKVLDDGTIVILVHYAWEPHDPYTELHYPPFDELWENEKFKKECMQNFFEHSDDKFVAELARWLQYGSACRYPCPLFRPSNFSCAERHLVRWRLLSLCREGRGLLESETRTENLI